MRQKGLTVANPVTIESLSYQFNNSNQLQKVSDGIPDNSPIGDFKDTTLTGDDYTYDVNGNVTKDYNRKMCTASNGSPQRPLFRCITLSKSLGKTHLMH